MINTYIVYFKSVSVNCFNSIIKYLTPYDNNNITCTEELKY